MWQEVILHLPMKTGLVLTEWLLEDFLPDLLYDLGKKRCPAQKKKKHEDKYFWFVVFIVQ